MYCSKCIISQQLCINNLINTNYSLHYKSVKFQINKQFPQCYKNTTGERIWNKEDKDVS